MHISKIKNYIVKTVYKTIKKLKRQNNLSKEKEFKDWINRLQKEEVRFVMNMEFIVWYQYWRGNGYKYYIPQKEVNKACDEVLQIILDN